MRPDTAHAHWNDRWATAEGRTGWTAPEPDVAARAMQLPAGARCLDLGCGVGRHALMLARMGHAVSALDAAPEGIAELRRAAADEGLRIDAREGRMTALPHADASFDYVLSFNVIYHGDRDTVARSIAEIARVLRPGGLFQGTMLSARNDGAREGVEVSPGTRVVPDAPAGSDKNHPHFFCDATEVLALFAGFEPLEIADREHEKPGSWHWHLVMERT